MSMKEHASIIQKIVHGLIIFVLISSFLPASRIQAAKGIDAPVQGVVQEESTPTATETAMPTDIATPEPSQPASQTPTEIQPPAPTETETPAPTETVSTPEIPATAIETQTPMVTEIASPTETPQTSLEALPEHIKKKVRGVEFTTLVEKTEQDGQVSVIVGLNIVIKSGKLNSSEEKERKTKISKVQDDLLKLLSKNNLKNIKKFQHIPYMAMTVDETTLNALLNSPLVNIVSLDHANPPALDLSVPWIGAPAAWAGGYTGSGQTIAILDTGIDKNHPFLTGKVVSEACYSTTNLSSQVTSLCPGGVAESTDLGSAMPYAGACPAGGCNHGTHVAGIAAGGDGESPSGVAYGANIIAIQVFSRFDNTASCSPAASPCIMAYDSDIINGLEQVYNLQGAYNIAAVNMSLGGGKYLDQISCDTANQPVLDQVINLRAGGSATIVAAGNEGYSDGLSSPGCLSEVISVGATLNNTNTVADYSNSAYFLHLLAPGSDIYSSIPGVGYTSMSGTSMAAPHVAGTWAILKQAKPDATIPQILNALTSTGVQITDPRNNITKPRIQVNAALAQLKPGPANITLSNSNVNENQPVGAVVGTFTTTNFAGTTITPCTYSLVSGVEDNASFTIDSNILKTNAVFDYETKNSYSIRIQTEDGQGGTFQKQFIIFVDYTGGLDVTARGYFTCAIRTGGKVQCWGNNQYGNLGDGTTINRSQPVNVVGLGSGVTKIDVGGWHTCAVTAGGGVKCWGWNNHGGQLGDGTTTDRSTPVQVVGLESGVKDIILGGFHNFAIMTNGSVKAWGYNASGQLGDGTTIDRLTPVDIVGLSGVVDMAAGSFHTCALMASGGVKCWGWNGSGQLGNGTRTDSTTPVDVVGLSSGVKDIVDTCALLTDGSVKCWGDTRGGLTPVAVSGINGTVIAVSTGYWHTCVLLETGAVKCWGGNGYGDLGDGTTIDRSQPVNVVGLSSGVITIAASDHHSCVLMSDNRVKCWGYNEYGQLGDGTTVRRLTPVDVVWPANVAPTDIGLSSSNVVENLPKDSTVGNFTTIDVDGGPTYTYSLVSGNGSTDNASFTIDCNTLKTNAVFDFEAKNSYSIRVQTNDGKGGTYQKQFTINVTDVNDAPTNITLSSSSIAENQPVGKTVGTFTTTDPDGGPTYTYTLVSGTGNTDNASFTIVGNMLKTNAVFDFEAKNSYSIRVQTNDGRGGTFQKQFTIAVMDVNEPPPAATLISPSGIIYDTTPTYRWNSASGATYYLLWVNGPSGNVISTWYTASQAGCAPGGTCSVTPSTTLSGGAHQWWIQTWNSVGYGPWSTGMTFSLSVPGGGFNSQFNGVLLHE